MLYKVTESINTHICMGSFKDIAIPVQINKLNFQIAKFSRANFSFRIPFSDSYPYWEVAARVQSHLTMLT